MKICLGGMSPVRTDIWLKELLYSEESLREENQGESYMVYFYHMAS